MSKSSCDHKLKQVWGEGGSYTSVKVIGEGGFGQVYIATRNSDGVVFAIKVQPFAATPPENPRQRANFQQKMQQKIDVFDKEINILRDLHHPHISYLHESIIALNYDEEKAEEVIELIMVLELCAGPELFDAVMEFTFGDDGNFTEKHGAEMFGTAVEAVGHLHKNNVAHLDIKPENFVFTGQLFENGKLKEYPAGEGPKLKLIDFGVAAQLAAGETFTINFFSMNSSPPEVLKDMDKKHTIEDLKAVDMWALGTVLYCLLTGCRPYDGDTVEELLEDMDQGLCFPDDPGDPVLSVEAVELLEGLLDNNAATRLTAAQAYEHPWMKANHDVSKNLLPDKIAQGLKHIGRSTKLKRAIADFVLLKAINIGEAASFQKEFAKADKDQDGMMDAREAQVFIQNHKLAEAKGLGATDEAELKEMGEDVMAAADLDQNGHIDVHEFARVLQMAELSSNEQLLEKVFDRLDSNQNGTISTEEISAAFAGGTLGQMVQGKEAGDSVFTGIAKDPTKLTLPEFKKAMLGQPGERRKKAKRDKTTK